MTLRVAMWSGPRNISTAMMRAWENRPDCRVIDEPFYACYLQAADMDHPMRDEVVASQSTDWNQVIDELTGSSDTTAIEYQKHMTHHMLPDVPLDWTATCANCFLIRDPAEVVNSYRQKRDSVTTGDIGIVRQLALYQEISSLSGQDIPVLDARSVLQNPKAVLSILCERLSIEFDEKMLSWPPGIRGSDGVWASHWYEVVARSTGFEPYKKRDISLTKQQQQVVDESFDAYRVLKAQAIGIRK